MHHRARQKIVKKKKKEINELIAKTTENIKKGEYSKAIAGVATFLSPFSPLIANSKFREWVSLKKVLEYLSKNNLLACHEYLVLQKPSPIFDELIYSVLLNKLIAKANETEAWDKKGPYLLAIDACCKKKVVPTKANHLNDIHQGIFMYYLDLGSKKLIAKKYRDARKHFLYTLEYPYKNKNDYRSCIYGLCEAELNLGKIFNSIKRLRELIKGDSEVIVESYLRLCSLLYSAGKKKELGGILEKIKSNQTLSGKEKIKFTPYYPCTEAIQTLTHYINKNKGAVDWKLHAILGKKLLQRRNPNDIQQAILHLGKSLKMCRDPLNQYTPLVLLGGAFMCKNDFSKAISYFERAQIFLQEPSTCINLAKLYLITNDTNLAKKQIQMIPSSDKYRIYINHLTGRLLHENKRYENAVKSYKKALKMCKDGGTRVELLEYIARAYISLNKFDLAKEYLTKALNRAPNSNTIAHKLLLLNKPSPENIQTLLALPVNYIVEPAFEIPGAEFWSDARNAKAAFKRSQYDYSSRNPAKNTAERRFLTNEHISSTAKLRTIADNHYVKRNYSAAIVAYEKAINECSSSDQILFLLHLHLGHAYYGCKSYREAIKNYTLVINGSQTKKYTDSANTYLKKAKKSPKKATIRKRNRN